MQDQDLRWLVAATGATRAPTSLPMTTFATWRRALHRLRYPVWPALILALALVGVLFQFQRVVAEGVVQGELRRSATAARADGLWRCSRIAQFDERRQCLLQVPGA